MSYDPISQYCASVCVMVRWKRCRAAITRELSSHMEDHADALIAGGMEEREARESAAAAMGDPYAVGKELDALHSPWYPRLSRIFSVLAALLLLCSAVVRFGSRVAYPVFAPFIDPAALLSEDMLAKGEAVGGGTLGAYSFSEAAVALYRIDAYTNRDGSPVYRLDLILSSQTPWFWLGNPVLNDFPTRLDDTAYDHSSSYYGALDTQGLFRRFTQVSIPVTPPFQSSYTFALGPNDELSYTVTLEGVPTP